MRKILIAPAVVLLLASTSAAQARGTKVHVTVADAATEVFLLGAEVTIQEFGLKLRTDFLGDARFPALPAGTYSIQARKVGYEPLTTPVRFSGRDSVEIIMLLPRRSQELPTVTIEESKPSPVLQEFEERRRQGKGYYVTDDQLQASFGQTLGAVVSSRIPGLTIRCGVTPDCSAYSTRGTHSTHRAFCAVAVYMNHMRVGNDPTIIPLDFVGGIEFYPTGRVPVEYQEPGNDCGVMILWPRP